MSRYFGNHHHHHHHHQNQGTVPKGRPVTPHEQALANSSFEHFLTASTLKAILGTYRHICDCLHLKPNVIPQFYPKLKHHVDSWKAKPLWKKFDARANQKCYNKGKACPNTRVLIIGSGPCGLRTAIEAQLLGAKVVVVEKRDRFSRNNVLHLWPFVIDDLRTLGAKKFFGKFCAGSIDHISIRQLQCILLKVALLLGVEIHTEVSFEHLIEPNPVEKTGWRAEFKPLDHPVNQYEFNVIIGADGKRNTLQGFKRKEFRGKLAIAITANFINKRTEAEARVEEISGVAFIFNQKFFKDLYADTGIDLENIVYYKDDTHYFVMTAKKQSLIEKGVIKRDLADTAKLLAPDNVDRDELMNYAREAAEFSTNYQMPDLEFAVNHYGQPDVAMFDFTSMYAAENASRVTERNGCKLLSILVGDSLLEPFWPTGSGCARGFLSSMDAAWALRSWEMAPPLQVIAERESIYRLLAQTTPENLNKDYKSYTLDPSTRYPNLNRNVLLPHQVTNLYDTDNVKSIDLKTTAIALVEVPKKRRRRESHVDPETLLSWIKEQVKDCEELDVSNITTSFKDGRILCAIIHHYRPDLLDYNAINAQDAAKNNQLAFDLLEKELNIPPVMTGVEMANLETPDYLTMLSYLTLIYDTFRCEIPHIKHPKLDLPEMKRTEAAFKIWTNDQYKLETPQITHTPSRHKRSIDPSIHAKMSSAQPDRKPRKRKTVEKIGASVEDRQKRLEEIVSNRVDRHNKRRQQRRMQTEQFIKSMQMLQSNCKPDHSEPFEDYSIYLYRQTAPNFEDRVKNLEKQFVYVPDRENRLPPTQSKRETDEEFAARIKDMEQKWQEATVVDKKPKDLLRAIGKIETSDWNIREIEKKINENKLGKSVNKDMERVPKWSKEQFSARLTKMEKQHYDRQNSAEVKYAEIDKNIKQLDLKLKEGSALELNKQKVATITEKLVGRTEPLQPKLPLQKSNSRTMVVPQSQGSEYCHFCSKRVYLMERLSAEGKFFHRGCFKCQYCQSLLRLGTYMFDRDGSRRFYCAQHFGMAGELRPSNAEKRTMAHAGAAADKQPVSDIVGLDLIDRVQTPERVEFANLSCGHVSSDHEESPSPIDEDEWTDRNFRNSTADLDSSDGSSSLSGADSDDEAYEEALEEPITKEGTLKWAERYKKRYSRKYGDDSDSADYSSSDHFSYDENSSGEEESDTATEGEEEIRARELRKQEVRVEPPVTDTGTDTEIATSEPTSSSSSEVQNSATEISTDSEFAHDDPTPTREDAKRPFDEFVTKTRGSGQRHHHHQQQNQQQQPKKVQIKSGVLQRPTANGRAESKDIELKFTPLIPDVLRRPNTLKADGYALNRTQSTGGIATKVSLELKKKYLLGEQNAAGGIQKSGSASTLDSKFKSFATNISDCQKLLRPASEISASMQVFFSKLNERTSPLSPIAGGIDIFDREKSSAEAKSPLKLDVLSIIKSASASSIPEGVKTNVNSITEKGDDKNTEEVFKNLITATEDVKKSIDNEHNRTTKTENVDIEEDGPCDNVNESEGRPRSPAHEKSIVVPVIDWAKTNPREKFVDSLSSSDSEDVELKPAIPKLEIHDDSGAVLPNADDVDDEMEQEDDEEEEEAFDSLDLIKPSDTSKSISSDRKTLNQPKTLPGLNDTILPELHGALHVAEKQEDDNRSIKSGRSSPSFNDDVATAAALTETELSDWARDGAVSDDFDDEYDRESTERAGGGPAKVRKATIDSLDEMERAGEAVNRKLRCVNILNPNIENIEFMDTGTEGSSDDNAASQNNGYVQFHNDEELEDSLSPVAEARNPLIEREMKIGNIYGQITANKMLKQICDNEDDSLLTIETGTTTEENTCSDSTVKLITVGNNGDVKTKENVADNVEKKYFDKINFDKVKENDFDKNKKNNFDKSNKNDFDKIKENDTNKIETEIDVTPTNDAINVPIEFEEHCQRLQSKIEFGNARDSIDVRKSRRKSKPDAIRPDLIREEGKVDAKPVPTVGKLYKKEEIEKERHMNQKLVQEMVMNKMKAQNKSLERKKRNRNSFSPLRPFELARCATADVPGLGVEPSPPDVLLSAMPPPPQKPNAASTFKEIDQNVPESLPDVTNDEFRTPKVPPRVKSDEAKRNAEKLKQDARARVRLMSDEDLGLSPEDKLIKLRQKSGKRAKENVDVNVQDSIESLVINTEKRNSLLHSNDTLKRNASFQRSNGGGDSVTKSSTDIFKLKQPRSTDPPMRTKSVSEINHPLTVKSIPAAERTGNAAFCMSDPNLLTEPVLKKTKDRERRRSFTRFVSDLFSKKKLESTTGKGILSRISPKGKNKSKSLINLDLEDFDQTEPILRRNSISEVNLRRTTTDNSSPPPIPPLPTNYTGAKGESSDGENEHHRDSCKNFEIESMHRRSSRGRKTSRQLQLQRHRMAQEIQRKLEETEVKTRELECRGVTVEKALRGEANGSSPLRVKDETELLKEWFGLMREMTELRRYEKDLMVQAQELELEDRHARLQQELRERLKINEPKTKEEVETEGRIIKEMMDIVAKRDSLIAMREEDRLRYSKEDRDFEEKMLAKKCLPNFTT